MRWSASLPFLCLVSRAAIGVVLALVLARALKSLIYEVSPTDPTAYVAIGFRGDRNSNIRLLHSSADSHRSGSNDRLTRRVVLDQSVIGVSACSGLTSG